MPSGVLLLDKPGGMSSNGVLDELKQILRTRLGLKTRDLPKLGHTGTLDPFATGLLPVVIDDASKLSRYLIGSDKRYQARMKLGTRTNTADLTGEVTEKLPVPRLEFEALQSLADRFCAEPYLQTPPMYSAKKQQGKALYELARQGIEVERAPVSCRLSEFKIENIENDEIGFSVCVTAGTYIRTLAEDFAAQLGTIAHLVALKRTSVAQWTLEEAVSLESIARGISSIDDLSGLGGWIEFDRLLDKVQKVQVTYEQALSVVHGKQAALSQLVIPGLGIYALVLGERLIATVTNTACGPTIERVLVDLNRLKTWSSDG
jgi:tRNA pseudouridine55 synthase